MASMFLKRGKANDALLKMIIFYEMSVLFESILFGYRSMLRKRILGYLHLGKFGLFF